METPKWVIHPMTEPSEFTRYSNKYASLPCICTFCTLFCIFSYTWLVDVSLTMHLSITLVNDQLDAQIFNTFITILYMFRAISCLSSGGQIILIQHLVSSLSVSDCSVHCTTCAPNGHLLRVAIPDAVLKHFGLLRMSKILLETCRGL